MKLFIVIALCAILAGCATLGFIKDHTDCTYDGTDYDCKVVIKGKI